MTWLSWLIVVIPLGFVIFQAIHARKYIRGVADYLAAGRVAGRYVLAVGDLEAALGVITLLWACEANYHGGFAIGFWSKLAVPLSLMLSLTGYCFYRFRETKALSQGQFLEMRYNKALRITAAVMRTVAEMTVNSIGPALAARFFIYFLGIPHTVRICGVELPSFVILVGFVIILCMIVLWHGGRLSLLVTDCIQGLMCYPIFVCFTVFFLTEFSWWNDMAPILSNRVQGQSFLNPFDVQELRDFNLFSLLVAWTAMVLNRGSWIDGTSSSGRTAHEQKMAGVLGSWRSGFSSLMLMLIAISVMTVMWHPNFVGKARDIRLELVGKVSGEVFKDAALQQEIGKKVAALPSPVRRPGIDKPLSQKDNPDTVYVNEVRNIVEKRPNGNFQFQEFRTLYYQMLTPVTMKHVFPSMLVGLFTLLMLMLMLTTDDSRIFNSSSTIMQDIILPLRKNGFPQEKHLLWLRLCTLGVAIFFFCGSVFMAQLDYIAMFCSIICSIWLGGAGPIMIGGLYSRFGNTVGAFCSLIGGSSMALIGVFLQRRWADMIYPFLERKNWVEPVGSVLNTVSGPFQPIIVWEMNPFKCPVNSYEFYFLAMMVGSGGYIIGSLLTYKKPFNLEMMLHRGAYDLDGTKQNLKTPWTWRNVCSKIIGITPEYTKWDKVIAWSVIAYSLGWGVIISFLGVIVWNIFQPWGNRWWDWYYYINWFVISLIVGAISTVWFVPCGIRDLRQMYRDLAARKENELDNGQVDGHVSLADKVQLEAEEQVVGGDLEK